VKFRSKADFEILFCFFLLIPTVEGEGPPVWRRTYGASWIEFLGVCYLLSGRGFSCPFWLIWLLTSYASCFLAEAVLFGVGFPLSCVVSLLVGNYGAAFWDLFSFWLDWLRWPGIQVPNYKKLGVRDITICLYKPKVCNCTIFLLCRNYWVIFTDPLIVFIYWY
jgi:hypothetical protein